MSASVCVCVCLCDCVKNTMSLNVLFYMPKYIYYIIYRNDHKLLSFFVRQKKIKYNLTLTLFISIFSNTRLLQKQYIFRHLINLLSPC